MIEKPVVVVSTKSMQQERDFFCVSLTQEVECQFPDLDGFYFRATIFFIIFFRNKIILKFLNKGIEFLIGDLFFGNYSKQGSYRQGFSRNGHCTA